MELDKDEVMRWFFSLLMLTALITGVLGLQVNNQKHVEEMAKKGYTQELVGSSWIWKKVCQ